jgi:hypothetical protein
MRDSIRELAIKNIAANYANFLRVETGTARLESTGEAGEGFFQSQIPQI